MEAIGKCLAPTRCGPEERNAFQYALSQKQWFSVQKGFFLGARL